MADNEHPLRDVPKLGPGEAQIEDLPFDLERTVTNAVDLFGPLGNGDNIGKWVKYVGAPVSVAGKDYHQYQGRIGEVIGDLHGRIVVELDEGYLGWLNPEDYQFINYIPHEPLYFN